MTTRIFGFALCVSLAAQLGCASTAGRMSKLWKSSDDGGIKVGSAPQRSWLPWNNTEDDPTQLALSDPSELPAPPAKKLTPEMEKKTDFVEKIAAGRTLEQSNQWDKARKLYETLVKDHPERSEARHRLAVVADRQKRHAEAQKHYSEAIRLDPKNAELFNDLGYSFFLSGQLPKAESALRKAVLLEPTNSRYHNNLGMVYGHSDKRDEALAEFREAGSEADAYFNLAFVYASQDKAEEAKACFRRAIATDPQHGKAREALASFELYENAPPELREAQEETQVAGDPRKWVPYVEGGESSTGEASSDRFDTGVQPASATLPLGRNAASANRAMLNDASSLRNRHYSSKRGEGNGKSGE